MLKPVSIARSGFIASGAVGWPHHASGAVRSGHLADTSVTSGDISSGSVGKSHVASGAIASGQLATTGTPVGTNFLRDDFSWASPGTSLTSGAVQSGHLSSGSVQGFFGATRDVASGTLGVFDLGSGAVVAGTLGSGAVQSGNLASGQVGFRHYADASVASGALASGQVGKPHIASGAVGSGQLAVGGTPTGTKLLQDDFTWVAPGAPSITSGSVGQTAFASGVAADYLAFVISGLGLEQPITEEVISGLRAVQLSQSGGIRVAMASVSGRMPAIGVVVDNVSSGIKAPIYQFGFFAPSSGLVQTSGQAGSLLFVGRSGDVSTASGWLNSGGLLSGDVSQPVGFFAGSGVIGLSVAAMLPFVPGLILSGNLGSGQVGNFHVASGTVQGHAGAGVPNVASGTINASDVGSGGIQSGNVASGQIGFGHLANASVQSGSIASGSLSQFHHASGAINSGQVGSGAVMGQAAAGAFTIASGSIATFDIASGAIKSGIIASGTVASEHLASGNHIDFSTSVTPLFSGGDFTVITSENISGIRAVCIDRSMSGRSVRIAMSNVSGRMPAIGVVGENVLSGIGCQVMTQGIMSFTSGLVASGQPGKLVYVGRSGQLVPYSGSFNSGGWVSGDILQPLGSVLSLNSGPTAGTFFINTEYPAQMALSGLINAPGGFLFL